MARNLPADIQAARKASPHASYADLARFVGCHADTAAKYASAPLPRTDAASDAAAALVPTPDNDTPEANGFVSFAELPDDIKEELRQDELTAYLELDAAREIDETISIGMANYGLGDLRAPWDMFGNGSSWVSFDGSYDPATLNTPEPGEIGPSGYDWPEDAPVPPELPEGEEHVTVYCSANENAYFQNGAVATEVSWYGGAHDRFDEPEEPARSEYSDDEAHTAAVNAWCQDHLTYTRQVRIAAEKRRDFEQATHKFMLDLGGHLTSRALCVVEGSTDVDYLDTVLDGNYYNPENGASWT